MGDTITTDTASSVQDGLATIESGSPLTRLHYFDGKYLRADALTLEQDYHRQLVRLGNIAGGWGVVHGFGIALDGGSLQLTPGLAITPAGSTVLLTQATSASIAKLIAAAQPSPADNAIDKSKNVFGDCGCDKTQTVTTESATSDYYEITVGPIQALCGQEEVYGKLCEDACVSDSQQPFWKEGLMLRLRPISLSLLNSSAVSFGDVHLRNRVASAYFASEPWLSKSLLSAQGLACDVWCQPAQLYARNEVPIGLLVREGASTKFIDAWSARRERMDTQARGYWQGRMRMRPWNVFIAQILQFQCQLSGVFKPGSTAFTPIDDDCARLRTLLAESARELEAARAKYEEGNRQIYKLLGADAKAQDTAAVEALDQPYQRIRKLAVKLGDAQLALKPYTPNRLLLSNGFAELPPAGYLPVQAGQQAINEQVQRMFGEGVNLYFCVCRPDYIAGAVEEAEHLDRISLTRGLDDPANKEDVEIFVPDGQLLDAVSADTGLYWQVRLQAGSISKILLGAAMQYSRTQDMKMEMKQSFMFMDTSAPEATDSTDTVEKIDPRVDADVTMLTGLARSAPLGDGGGSLTLVCQPPLPAQWLASSAARNYIMGEYIADPNSKDTGATAKEEAAPATSRRVLGVYLDLRIQQDPFAQQEGDEIPLAVEWRALMEVTDATGITQKRVQSLDGEGRLAIDALYSVSNNIRGADATARLRMELAQHSDSSDTQKDFSFALPLKLRRRGDARTGMLTIMAADRAQREGSALAAQWSGTPRDAVFGPLGSSQYTARSKQYADQPIEKAAMNEMLIDAEDELIQQLGERIDPYALMHELSAAPKPESPQRLAVLNILSQIAEAADDDAFLARARRRLFPDTTPTDAVLRVRATRDWLAFRRRRRAQCDQDCGCVQASTIEAFQTWHLRVDGLEQAQKLMKMIDAGKVESAEKLGLKRVDVLHYTDAATSPSESQTELLSDWRHARPGPQLAFARIWERSPTTGQGWQNHGRLKRVLQLLEPLIDTPDQGALKALPDTPSFAEREYDGGMLLITIAEQKTIADVAGTNADIKTNVAPEKPAVTPAPAPAAPVAAPADVKTTPLKATRKPAAARKR